MVDVVEKKESVIGRAGLLREQEAAAMLGVTIRAMQCWRFQGRGPRWIAVGRLARYREQDILDFIAANERGVNAQPPASGSDSRRGRPRAVAG